MLFEFKVNRIKCSFCDMTCIDKNDLSKHILYKHTTSKNHKCSNCEYALVVIFKINLFNLILLKNSEQIFRSKSERDLQKHVQLMHSERSEYQCNECEYKTKNINHIKRHMLKFHLVRKKVCFYFILPENPVFD